MRHVFPTSEIPHKWAHQTQDNARNPQGNLYFRGDTLYSYRDSYPIAKIFKKKGARPSIGEHGAGGLLNATVRAAHEGKTLVLHVEDTYSATTAGHCSGARRATSHLPSITVPDVEPDNQYRHSPEQHAINVRYLVELAAKHLDKAGRAMQLSSVTWRRDAAKQALADAQAYSAFFGIRRKVPAFPELAWNAAAARAGRIENPDPVSKDARERASAKRKAAAEQVTEYRQAMAESMKVAGHWIGYRATVGKRWPKALARLVGEKGRPWYHDMAERTNWRLNIAHAQYARHGTPVMLRVNGEEIETSQGARIPLAAAPMVWNIVQRSLGKGFVPAGLGGVKIGDYPLTRIEADGTLVAGCHKIPHSELRSMARQLNLAAV